MADDDQAPASFADRFDAAGKPKIDDDNAIANHHFMSGSNKDGMTLSYDRPVSEKRVRDDYKQLMKGGLAALRKSSPLYDNPRSKPRD